MFDYQAGEKYRLTLIMVGLAGLLAGIFFTILLVPSPEPSHRSRPQPAYMRDPDVTGRREMPTAQTAAAPGAAQAMPPSEPIVLANPMLAKTLVEQWLPYAWDLSAGSAKGSQERALLAMTPDCAAAYQKNIWTPDLAKQIEESGLQSAFKADNITVGDNLADGSVVVYVNGTQTLNVPSKGSTARQVRLEYMVKMTQEGLRIAGISEGGKSM